LTDYRDKTVCCVDCGLFVEFARIIAPAFKRVLYFTEWVSPFPVSNDLIIGCGIPGITRIDSIWPHIDDIDLFVFNDVYHGPLQVYLDKIGKRVWGCRSCEELEIFRVASKEHQQALGIPIGPYTVVHGLADLRTFLKAHDDVWIKISKSRGDMETWHSPSYKVSEPRLDELEWRLGAKKKIMEFVVEQDISPAIEVGYDGYSIDGCFPKTAMLGLEAKDDGLLGQVMPYANLPPQAIDLNARLASTFAACRYRGSWSSEIRITGDGIGYSIDPCCRQGSPPGELMQLIISNWPDIIWEGAEGNLIEPEFTAPWGAELMMHSPFADKNWVAIDFPPDLRDHVKFRNLTVIDGKYYVAPHATGVAEIGAVVATGASMAEAIDNVRDIAEEVEGYDVEFNAACLDDIEDDFARLTALNNQRKVA
jgi:hypothetical protein